MIIHKFENIWPIADRFGAEEFACGKRARTVMIWNDRFLPKIG
jgi:hypothetical protein